MTDLVSLSDIQGRLTPRELDVVRLMAQGKSHRQVGEALTIEEVTVRSHATTIYSKMQVHNRAQAVSKAIYWGLIEAFILPARDSTGQSVELCER